MTTSEQRLSPNNQEHLTLLRSELRSANAVLTLKKVNLRKARLEVSKLGPTDKTPLTRNLMKVLVNMEDASNEMELAAHRYHHLESTVNLIDSLLSTIDKKIANEQ